MSRRLLVPICLLLLFHQTAVAGVTFNAAREVAEYVMGKFGKEAAEGGLDSLARKIEALAVKYGDEAVTAVKKVGPRSIRIIAEAGEHGPQVLRLMARHGNDSMWVVTSRHRMAIFIKHGDAAAESMIKHGQLAEPLLENFGKSSVSALHAVSPQNGRRLAMMADADELVKIGRTSELLDVVGHYGDKAMDFIWKHKGALAVKAVLTAFLNDPLPFIEGAKDITKVLAPHIGRPLAIEIAGRINWTAVVLSMVAAGVMTAWLVLPRKRRVSGGGILIDRRDQSEGQIR